jgi:DNA-directed RNA polymerase specialized sigma24 family protein
MLSAQARFEAVLPRLRLIIAKYFRSYYNQDDKDDAIAEAIALSWRRFRALIQRGTDPDNLGYSIGSRAALQVHRGTRWTVTNQKRGRSIVDPLWPPTRRKLALRCHQLNARDLCRSADIPDIVAFRIDFATWRSQWSKRDLAIIDARLAGYTCLEIAQKLGVNRWNVNRRLPRYYMSWTKFAQT